MGRCCLALHVWFVRAALLVWGMRSVASKDIFADERQQPLRALADEGCLARYGKKQTARAKWELSGGLARCSGAGFCFLCAGVWSCLGLNGMQTESRNLNMYAKFQAMGQTQVERQVGH